MRLRQYIPSKDYEYLHKWIDNERLHALWCANLIPYPLSCQNLQEVLDEDARNWGSLAYVAVKEHDTPIGFFVLSVNKTNNSGFLKFAITDSKLRGQGYGTQMIRLMLKHAFETAGLSFVQLNVFDSNDNARRCYTSAGFIEDSFIPDAFTFGNESWGRCHMKNEKN